MNEIIARTINYLDDLGYYPVSDEGLFGYATVVDVTPGDWNTCFWAAISVDDNEVKVTVLDEYGCQMASARFTGSDLTAAWMAAQSVDSYATLLSLRDGDLS